LATTRCEFDFDCSLIKSRTQPSRPDERGTRLNRRMASGLDIQPDRATCSAVTRKSRCCAKRCVESDGVERLGNMFSLTPKTSMLMKSEERS
jgi:hypothetical protein